MSTSSVKRSRSVIGRSKYINFRAKKKQSINMGFLIKDEKVREN
jgi:hypothetical protein